MNTFAISFFCHDICLFEFSDCVLLEVFVVEQGGLWRMKDFGKIRQACNGRREHDTDLGCFSAMHEGLWHRFPLVRPSVGGPHRVLLSSGERQSFFVLVLLPLVLREVGFSRQLLFPFCPGYIVPSILYGYSQQLTRGTQAQRHIQYANTVTPDTKIE